MTWEYLAGFIDGDGWVTMTTNQNCATQRWALGMTQLAREEWAFNRISDFLRSHEVRAKVRHRISTGLLKTKTPMVDIQIRHQQSLVILLENIVPHLVIKKEIAERCLAYVKLRVQQRGVGLVCPERQKTNIYWSKQEVAKLLDMHDRGYSNTAIAANLQRSAESIGHKLNRLRILRCHPQRCHGDAIIEVLQEMEESDRCVCMYDAEGFCPKHGLITD